MPAPGKLVLRNYRCFDWNNPATLEFGDGFTALLGPNNSGKSSALRSIYELRPLLENWHVAFSPSNGFRANVMPQGVADVVEVANDADPSAFEFSIEVSEVPPPGMPSQLVACAATLRYDPRNQALLPKDIHAVNHSGDIVAVDHRTITTVIKSLSLGRQDQTEVHLGTLNNFATDLRLSRYYPAFRNAINEGSGRYYDLPVGTALVNTWDQWKAGNIRSQKIAISKVEDQIATLLGFRTLQINADQSGKTWHPPGKSDTLVSEMMIAEVSNATKEIHRGVQA